MFWWFISFKEISTVFFFYFASSSKKFKKLPQTTFDLFFSAVFYVGCVVDMTIHWVSQLKESWFPFSPLFSPIFLSMETKRFVAHLNFCFHFCFVLTQDIFMITSTNEPWKSIEEKIVLLVIFFMLFMSQDSFFHLDVICIFLLFSSEDASVKLLLFSPLLLTLNVMIDVKMEYMMKWNWNAGSIFELIFLSFLMESLRKKIEIGKRKNLLLYFHDIWKSNGKLSEIYIIRYFPTLVFIGFHSILLFFCVSYYCLEKKCWSWV